MNCRGLEPAVINQSIMVPFGLSYFGSALTSLSIFPFLGLPLRRRVTSLMVLQTTRESVHRHAIRPPNTAPVVVTVTIAFQMDCVWTRTAITS